MVESCWVQFDSVWSHISKLCAVHRSPSHRFRHRVISPSKRWRGRSHSRYWAEAFPAIRFGVGSAVQISIWTFQEHTFFKLTIWHRYDIDIIFDIFWHRYYMISYDIILKRGQLCLAICLICLIEVATVEKLAHPFRIFGAERTQGWGSARLCKDLVRTEAVKDGLMDLFRTLPVG